MRSFILIIGLFLTVSGFAQIQHDYLLSRMNGVHFMEDNTTITIWGYGRYNTGGPIKISMPGPLLRYNQGDSAVIHFWNDSNEDHTIHLHGLDANQANDGVPTTSVAIDPNDSITYSFNADYSGVYLYHCHVTTTLHLVMGMYGMLVIDYPGNKLYAGGPSYTMEYDYLCSDMDVDWNNNPISPGPFYLYHPTNFFINGKEGTQMFTDQNQIINAAVGDTVLLRIANVGYTIQEWQFPPDCNATIHMGDGRPAPSPLPKDTLKVYPGERFSILLTPQTLIEDFIAVDYVDMFNDDILYTNYIGFNKNFHPLSLDELESKSNLLKVYPNPASDMATIELNQPAESNTIRLISIDGRIISIIESSSSKIIINTKAISSGTYYLQHIESGAASALIIK